MGLVLRGLRAVALLAGFYVLLLALLAIMVALDVTAITQAFDGSEPASTSVRTIPVFLLITAVVAVAGYRACTVSTKLRVEEFGVVLDPAREPALTARVAALAEVVGTRAPDEIWIVNEVNAAVAEESRLLGLIAGKRRMMIGAPLLLTLTPAQLDAVLAHELGHYSNRDTRFTPLIGRGRRALQAALGSTGRGRRRTRTRGGRVKTVSPLPGQGTLFRVLAAYAKLFYLVTQADARRAEYAADRYSALAAGREAAASALGELPAAGPVFGFFLERYVASGLELGLVPSPEVLYPGFVELLAQPERQAELAQLRAKPPVREQSRYDSHPPIPERMAAIRALPEGGAAGGLGADGADGSARAVSILVDPSGLLGAAAAKLLEDHADKRPVAWPELVGAAAHAQDLLLGERLGKAVTGAAGRIGSLEVLLDLAEAGQADAVYTQLARAHQGSGPAARKRAFGRCVRAWIVVELEKQGRATRRLSWTEFEAVDLEPGLQAEVEAGLAAIVALASWREAAGSGPVASAEENAAAVQRLRKLLELG